MKLNLALDVAKTELGKEFTRCPDYSDMIEKERIEIIKELEKRT